MSRGKQYVKKGVWYIGGKRKGRVITFGLIASLAAPVLSDVAKPILGKILGRGRRRKRGLRIIIRR